MCWRRLYFSMVNCSTTRTEPILATAADVVACEVEQHQMLGVLLGVGQQLVGELLVLFGCGAAPDGAERAAGW